MSANLLYESAGHVTTITINRPDRRNALDLPTLDALHEAWLAAEGDVDVRVVVITGAGDEAFSAGADRKEFSPDGRPPPPTHPAFFPELVLHKPLVAAVNGLCIAGGCELVLACDVRIAGEGATFALPEPQRGLFPAGGSAVRAPRRLGWANAMDLLLTGDPVDAEAALRMGLVSRVVAVDDVLGVAQGVAARIAANGREAIRAIKECALSSDGLPLDVALERQADYAKRAHASADAAEGIKAFRERRPPRF